MMVTRVKILVIVMKISATATTVASKIPAARDTLQHFIPRLTEDLDRSKIPGRNGVYILMAAEEAFRCDAENLVINFTFF